MRSNRGFTLVELLIVIVLIVIVGAVAVSAMSPEGRQNLANYATDPDRHLRQAGIYNYEVVPYTGGCPFTMRDKTIRVKPKVSLGDKNVCCNGMTCEVRTAW